VLISAHQVEFMPAVVAGMKRGLRRRQRENQPAVSRIHRPEPEHIVEKGAVSVGILAVNDHMRTEDQELIPPALT
jgi:hypothetical protein